MMWRLLTALFISVLPHVCAKSLRQNPELLTFNTDINANITAKIQDEAVIISLQRTTYFKDDFTKENILFGFDIFNFVPENFRVSVHYPKKKIFMNLTSSLYTYSIEYHMKKIKKIDSLFLRLSDDDNRIFIVVNCESSNSSYVITPINFIKFFRIAAMNKFKILFNRRYVLDVYTEGDEMKKIFEERCNSKKVLPQARSQMVDELDAVATKLAEYSPQLYSFLYSSENKSEVGLEIFIKYFLPIDEVHKTSNVNRLVSFIKSLSSSFPEIFQAEMQVLLSKLFWTNGKEHRYVRKWRHNYYNDVDIKNELMNILFANSPKTFLDSVKTLSKMGRKFRQVFVNPKISINEVMRNDSYLKDTLLDIVFQKPLDEDQLNLLNPNHIIKTMFASYYLTDLNENPEILNNIQKQIIFHADENDYITIGKFLRYIFFKETGFSHANVFLESDLVIGMRVVYVLSSGQMGEKSDIYWTVRSLITREDVELPKALEYPETVISNTLHECFMNREKSRYIFMQTLENHFIYKNPKIGSFLDYDQGAFIYNLYRDLIMNDIKKGNSVLKKILLRESSRIQDMIASMVRSVVANIDNVKAYRRIAIDFVNDTLSYAKVDASDVATTEDDYVQIFKKIVGKASTVSLEQKKINFRMILLKLKFENLHPGSDAIEEALSQADLKLDKNVKQLLKEVYKKYGTSTETLVKKIDQILEDKVTSEEEFEDIVAQDISRGVTFGKGNIMNDSRPLFIIGEDEDDESIAKERYEKVKELKLVEDWFIEQPKHYPNSAKSSMHSENFEARPITDDKKYHTRKDGYLTSERKPETKDKNSVVFEEKKVRQVNNGTSSKLSDEKGGNYKESTITNNAILRMKNSVTAGNEYGTENGNAANKVIIVTDTVSDKNASDKKFEEAPSQVESSGTKDEKGGVTEEKENGTKKYVGSYQVRKVINAVTIRNKIVTTIDGAATEKKESDKENEDNTSRVNVKKGSVTLNDTSVTKGNEYGTENGNATNKVIVGTDTVSDKNGSDEKFEEAPSRVESSGTKNEKGDVTEEKKTALKKSIKKVVGFSQGRKMINAVPRNKIVKRIDGTVTKKKQSGKENDQNASRVNVEKGTVTVKNGASIRTDEAASIVGTLVANEDEGAVSEDEVNGTGNDEASSQENIDKGAVTLENSVGARIYGRIFQTKTSETNDTKGATSEEKTTNTGKDGSRTAVNIDERNTISIKKEGSRINEEIFQIKASETNLKKNSVTENDVDVSQLNADKSAVTLENVAGARNTEEVSRVINSESVTEGSPVKTAEAEVNKIKNTRERMNRIENDVGTMNFDKNVVVVEKKNTTSIVKAASKLIPSRMSAFKNKLTARNDGPNSSVNVYKGTVIKIKPMIKLNDTYFQMNTANTNDNKLTAGKKNARGEAFSRLDVDSSNTETANQEKMKETIDNAGRKNDGKSNGVSSRANVDDRVVTDQKDDVINESEIWNSSSTTPVETSLANDEKKSVTDEKTNSSVADKSVSQVVTSQTNDKKRAITEMQASQTNEMEDEFTRDKMDGTEADGANSQGRSE